MQGDFSQPLQLPGDIAARPRLGFFPGSTIGNLTPNEAVELLSNMRAILGASGRLIIGADLKKDVRRLIAAYDDAAGVTAAFNLNLLHRANHELGADFDVAASRMRRLMTCGTGASTCTSSAAPTRRCACRGTVSTLLQASASTPSIRTSTTSRASATSRRGPGGQPQSVWTDAENLFSVHVLAAAR